MSYSKLTNKYIPASPKNYSKGRTNKVLKLTPHHMAGNLSIESCGAIFQNPSRGASSNYGIGTDGRIACYVDEENRAWTSSSGANDNQAITVEIANDGGAPNWHVSDKAVEAFINLAVDICKRHGIAQIKYTGDTSGNLTRHNMFTATTCPGAYLQGKFPWIAEQINARLNSSPAPTPTPTPGTKFKVGDRVVINGGLYVSSTASAPTGKVTNKETTITRVASGSAHPYNTTGDLGWMNEADIKLVGSAPAPTPSTDLVKGDSIIVNGVGTADSLGGGAKTRNYSNHKAKVMGGKRNGRYPLNMNNDLNGVTGWFPEGSIRRV